MARSAEVLHVRLYIAGNAPNSMRALANITAILQALPRERFVLEVVDVLAEPLRALQDKVFVTPLLCKLAPPPEQRIIGDLNDHAQVCLALGLREGEP